jgi:hypothetical protein
VYNLFADVDEDKITTYFINYYWLVSSLYFMVIFIKVCSFTIIKDYKIVAYSTAAYWGVMSAFRIYLFFNIEKYKQLTKSADTLTIGCVSIIAIFIYLIYVKWFKK